MGESKPARTDSWLQRPTTWLIAVALVVLLAFGYWLMPKRSVDVASLDGKHRWSADDAPLRRKVIWQPAEPVDPLGAEAGAGDSLIRPFLADDGDTLYFTLRKGEGGADIYRARKVDRQWQPAEPVAVLNSEADDFGPVIRADGKELFLYSNREGGHGEFDLYVSEMTDSGWSPPRNLGPYINSPADEYDPAITPDGKRLFFESNRSPRMQKLVASGKLAQGPDPWQGTLRVEKGLNQFDLYQARRPQTPDGEAAEGQEARPRWTDVTPLIGLNRKDSNEGAPYVDAAGVLLYFVSDRPLREGEDTNYDIYRARIVDDVVGMPENLGPGVNSAASEIEPALSRTGFQLFFSRSELDEGEQLTSAEQYALYRSDAIEIEEVAAWDDGNLQSFIAFLIDNWWWIVLLLLLAAILAAIAWALQNLNWRRVQVPTYLLIALLVHFMLFGGSFYVYFGDELIQIIKKQFQDELVVEASSSEMHQSHKPGQESYEKLADVDVETVKPSEIARQDVQSPNVPAPSDTVIPRIPAKVVPSDAPKLTDVLPTVEVQTDETIELARREEIEPLDESEMVELETTEAPAEQPVERPQQTVDVKVDRTQPTTELAQAPQLPDLPPRNVNQPAEFEPLEAVPLETANPATAPTEPAAIARSDTAPVETTETLQVPTEELAAAPAAETAAPFKPASAKVVVQRQDATDAPSQLAEPLEVALNTSRPATAATENLKPAAEGAAAAVPTSEAVPSKLNRANTARAAVDAIETEQVATTDIAGAPARQAEATQPAAVDVQLAKQADAATARTAFKSIAPAAAARPSPSATEADVSAADAASDVAQPKSVVLASNLAPREFANPARGALEAEQVATSDIAGAPAPQAEAAQPAAVDVQLAKQADAATGRTAFKSIAAAAAARPSPSATEADVSAADAASDVAQPKSVVLASNLAPRKFISPARGALEAEQVPTDEVAGSPAPQAQAARPAAVNVELAKQAAAATARTAFKPITAAAAARPNPSATQADVSAADAASDVAQPKSTVVASNLGLRKFEATSEEVETAAVDAPAGPPVPASNKAAAAAKITGVQVDLKRAASELPQLPEASVEPISGPQDAQRTDLQLAGLADKVVDAELAFGPVKTELELPTAAAPETDFAFDSIDLQTLLVRRQIAQDEKAALVKKFGGTDATLAAVRRGLSWIEMHQHEDGRWSFDKFQQRCRHDDKKKCNGNGKSADTGATGFALLPFLGDGHTHLAGDHKQAVSKALDWLVKHQKPDGDLWAGGDGNSRMYSQGIASIALCEAYGMTEDPKLREPAQRAVNFIVASQGNTGGWRYQPRDPGGDTSVLGWQVMALKSAQMADLYVPARVLKDAEKWLDRVAGQGNNLGQYGYTNQNDVKPAMTAEALLCLEYMGVQRNDPRLDRGAQFLLKNLPAQGKGNSYYWYYGTQVMYHMQGDYWKQWEESMRSTLLGTQRTEGNMAGTWDPKDQWENSGGRIFSTSVRVLMLEVYYRHLPLYQPLQ